MRPNTPPKLAVVLVNLGTPDEPTAPAVRRYLRQFLSDTRVIEIPKVLWAIILNLFILPFRPKRVAHAYASIWEDDSPIRSILQQQVTLLQQRFDEDVAQNSQVNTGQIQAKFAVKVFAGMTYGKPALTEVLDEIHQQGIEHLVVLPLYPQYSAATVGAAFDVVAKWGLKQRNLPNVSVVKDYFHHPAYIKALANSVKRYQQEHGKPDKLLMSFHGIPQPNEDKGDPYARRCRCTAGQLAHELGLNEDEWLCSFQSRFGKQEWVKPYTDVILKEWGEAGVASVQVISPAFSADCLETLEELQIENRDNFLQAGGQSYAYIPALNTDDQHIDLMQALTLPLIDAWRQTLVGFVASED